MSLILYDNEQNQTQYFSHIVLCNILNTILKPNFEAPLDTAKQLVEKNIILYKSPGSEIQIQIQLFLNITYWERTLLLQMIGIIISTCRNMMLLVQVHMLR